MSAPSSVSPETLITVKATFDGNTRRFKLALKEVGPSIFQAKLRELLAVPQSQDVKFERYSDSAASYVTLDPQNTAVYKQLFRAAKAKLKLRIKVTSVINEAPIIQSETASSYLPPSYSTANVNIVPSASTSTAPCETPTIAHPAQIDEAVAKAVNSYCSSTEFTSQLRDTVREEVEKTQQSETNDLISLEKSSEVSLESKPALEGLMETFRNVPVTCAYAIYCNSCNGTIHGLHYHCEECDGGDYDLCDNCTDRGIHCYERMHMLTRRDLANGKPVVVQNGSRFATNSRICNCCVGRFGDDQCVVCLDCMDFDLCVSCLRNGEHGHDPRHTFLRAHQSVQLSKAEEALLSQGRSVRHDAICDNCDQNILGVRHKCIDCPDWDYCNKCVKMAPQTHPNHRFVPVFDNAAVAPINKHVPLSVVMHSGVYCDGPICAQHGHGIPIRGARYKCAICPDTDFCATCEASPLNQHNSSHPLIKFKTPIRNVLVTTTDNTNTVMGDQIPEQLRDAEKEEPVPTTNTATQVQTIADVKPTEEFAALVETETSILHVEEEHEEEVEEIGDVKEVEDVKPVVEEVKSVEKKEPEPLEATFFGEGIADGTSLPVGQDFTQTWYMKNTGKSAWPVGITVKFVGGDYMFLKSEEDSLNSTLTDHEVQPGEIASFSVGLSATWPPNKPYISYWRLTAADGSRFGDRIWCSINVQEASKMVPQTETHEHEEDAHSETYSSESVVDVHSVRADSVKEETESIAENMIRSQASSEMVFPKLPVESPVHSLEHLPLRENVGGNAGPTSPSSDSSHKTFALSDDGDLEEEIDIGSVDNDSFLTDDEYDVLDASDEEFEECERIV